MNARKGNPPEKTHLEIVFDVPAHIVNAAADEIVTVLNETFQRIYRERRIDGRVSLSIARAVVARMYMTLTSAEQAASQEFAHALTRKLQFLIVPTGVDLSHKGAMIKP